MCLWYDLHFVVVFSSFIQHFIIGFDHNLKWDTLEPIQWRTIIHAALTVKQAGLFTQLIYWKIHSKQHLTFENDGELASEGEKELERK